MLFKKRPGRLTCPMSCSHICFVHVAVHTDICQGNARPYPDYKSEVVSALRSVSEPTFLM